MTPPQYVPPAYTPPPPAPAPAPPPYVPPVPQYYYANGYDGVYKDHVVQSGTAITTEDGRYFALAPGYVYRCVSQLFVTGYRAGRPDKAWFSFYYGYSAPPVVPNLQIGNMDQANDQGGLAVHNLHIEAFVSTMSVQQTTYIMAFYGNSLAAGYGSGPYPQGGYFISIQAIQ